MIGVHMGLQDQPNGEPVHTGLFENLIRRLGRGLARLVVVVQHRVDHRSLMGHGISHKIADGIGGFIEESVNDWLAHDDLRYATSLDNILRGLYISNI